VTTGAPQLPTLSVVIPTNRPLQRIRPTLDSALRDDGFIEVLLVVDGPGAETLGAELDAIDAATPRLRVLRLPERVGAEVARRIGAEAALGEVVWFIDDDVVPEPGVGAGHARAHAETGADIVVGLFTTPGGPDASVPARLYDGSFRHEWNRFVDDPSSILRGFWAGNHSVRRASVLGLDVVPAAFRYVYHSDRAFGLACERAGMVAVARPELRATHRYAPTLDRWRRDCRRQGAGRVEIHRAFSDLLGPDIENPWREGLGRRGCLALSVAQLSRPIAGLVANALASMVRLTTRLHRLAAALEFGKILRSVEQFRGAQAAATDTDSGIAFAVPDALTPVAAPAPAAVSLLVVSRGPGSQLRRVLEVWRPHVSEIVVVADRSGEPGLLEAVAGLADRTATVESAFPIESVLERCWPLCRQPFVFRADDDEVPSTMLLAELRSLTLDPTLQQAGIPMRWLWPDAATWIDEYPWTANPQPKLMRNHAGLTRFPGRVHTAEHLDGPIRAVNLPVYHLRTLDPLADRQARVTRYAAIGGGAPHFDGRPANSQYLPEDGGDLRRVAVPAWDRATVARVVAGVDGGARADSTAAPAASRPRPVPEPIVLSGASTLQDSARRASVRVTAVHPPVVGEARVVLEIVVANRSDVVLPGSRDAKSAVTLSTRWRPSADRDASVPDLVTDGQRVGLGEPIPPGRAISRIVALDVPVEPGRWRVSVDLVEESVAWFGDGDEFLVDIPPRSRVARPSATPAVELFHSILIETRNICTRHCWFCKFGQERQDAQIQQMDWDTIRRILANLRDLNYRGRISWYNINEPLQDPRIFEILEITRRHCPDAFLSLATNGDLLTAEKYRKLKDSGLDTLGVSIYDDETLAHVERLADERMVLMDMRDARPGRLENRGGNVHQEAGAFEAQRRQFIDAPCERPSTMMTVNAAGVVTLCCADMYADVVMGNVRDERLEDIWYNDRFTHYRRTLAASGRRSLKLCSDCSYSGTGVRPFFPMSEAANDVKVAVRRGRAQTDRALDPS
jgi:radical SAM protein with 4Fe4S-binding SPASM domain